MNFTFHDYQPVFEHLITVVINGLSQSPKVLHPKFFYDEKGSQMFDRICEQPEYYVPDIERSIFQDYASDIIECIGKQAVIIEPGAGSSIKIRFFLDRMQGDLAPAMYVPMDISAEHLKASAQQLADEYPNTRIDAMCVDHTKPYDLPDDVPLDRRVFFYPGSSLGNFEPEDAINFLSGLREKAGQGEGGSLLIGVDTKKPTSVLNAAYNDEAGATAAFNLNLLARIRKELDADVSPEHFYHHAFYNESKGRIEMHLHSKLDQTVRVNDKYFEFVKDESIHTENSYKYTKDEFWSLAHDAGWQGVKAWQDKQAYFGLYYFVANG